MDFDTGEKQPLNGPFMDELIAFTGRGGEFFRSGQDGLRSKRWSGDQITSAHLTVVPGGQRPPHDLWRLTLDPKGPVPGMMTNRPRNPPIRMGPNANLFAIGIPRPAGERSGANWHLINRDRQKWRFPAVDNGGYISPYGVAGFADNGKNIVAYDSTRLFTLPVSAIMVEENEAK